MTANLHVSSHRPTWGIDLTSPGSGVRAIREYSPDLPANAAISAGALGV